MPELPDILLYLHCLAPRILDRRLERISIISPFVLRSVEPPIEEAEGRTIRELRHLGKRLVFGLEGDLFLVIHLMIAGRLRWKAHAARQGTARPPKIALAALCFSEGTLLLTEAGTRKRASLHLVRGAAALRQFDRGGLDVLTAPLASFRQRLRLENRTLKRALADPRLFSGIGNAYSDEILHRARLSPVTLTQRLDDAAVRRLFDATRSTLQEWTERLQDQFGDGFPGPGDVTAFRPEMAVHGRFGQPCPDCGAPVQRIVYAENETNYCPRCQTGGRILADRSLSRLLKQDWPRTVEELEGDG